VAWHIAERIADEEWYCNTIQRADDAQGSNAVFRHVPIAVSIRF